jgi:PBSX family phage terminase large subunit
VTAVEPLQGKGLQSVLEANRRINLWEGSVRSSKTVSSLVTWLKYVRTGPPGNLVMAGKTERTLKRNVVDVLEEWLGKKRCKAVWGDGELHLLGRRIYLAGANDEKAQEKIRGLTLAGAYVDEVSVLPESFWSMLLTRLSVDGAAVFGTTNPDSPVHWLMRDYLKRPAVHIRHDGTVARTDGPEVLDLARFSFNLRDNPHLSAAYIDALGREFTGLWRLRFVEGLWVVAEGAIYDSLEERTHRTPIEPDPADVEQYVVAVDYGTTNPFVALLLAVTAERVWVLREWRWDSKVRGRQLTDAEYSAHLTRWLAEVRLQLPDVRVEKTIVDPSAASFIAQLWRDAWPGVTGAKNDVADGIRITSSLFASNRLLIHPTCTGLWDELLGYVWDPKAADKGNEQPLKIADHGPDALRYGIMGLRAWWRHWIIAPTIEVEQQAA